ncbi:emerin isoform X1 [Bombina bombina]|uniref:emerin isoform X1 n=1 Tax=Bombina bombina TaxID=8345 RepID=UPI00235A9E01|nr:emerin isoform X1 [Bombina bombina]XP_053551719.1 emerin isoform X1 [Bombina bombina]
MEQYNKMTDEELIRTLKKYGMNPGPIVGTTRTLYEKKLYEVERTKTRYPPSSDSSVESREEERQPTSPRREILNSPSLHEESNLNTTPLPGSTCGARCDTPRRPLPKEPPASSPEHAEKHLPVPETPAEAGDTEEIPEDIPDVQLMRRFIRELRASRLAANQFQNTIINELRLLWQDVKENAQTMREHNQNMMELMAQLVQQRGQAPPVLTFQSAAPASEHLAPSFPTPDSPPLPPQQSLRRTQLKRPEPTTESPCPEKRGRKRK